MTDACPLPSPEERRYGAIQRRIQEAMMRKISAALQEAAEQAQTEVMAAGLDMAPPSPGYLTSVAHQQVFCTLCKADPDSFAGGDPGIATAVIQNMRNIARHYWGADL